MLKQRVLSALAMAVTLLLVLFALPPLATLLLITLVVLAAAWECAGLWRGEGLSARVIAVLVIAALLPLVWRVSASPAGLRAILRFATLWWSFALLWLLAAPQRVPRLAPAVVGLCALLPAWAALIHLRGVVPHGAGWLLLALAIVFAADTGAYFAGRGFGRVKLAPLVSPGKTWEGVCGGVLLAVLVAAIGGRFLGIPVTAMTLSAALGAAGFSVVGDLTESMLKRHAGVKDSGSLLPGHGGVLDRVDSLCAGVPVLLLCWLQFGVLP